jgi:mitochondrial Rho GTPase 1
MTLVKDSFIPNIQTIVPTITIPPNTDSNLTTTVVDTSGISPRSRWLFLTVAHPSQREHLIHEIRRSNVICLVYSDAYTSSRITLFWLPFFRSMGVNLPIVLVANKSDLVSEREMKRALTEEMVPVMQEFKEVESCIRCSAKANVNVNEVFYLCQRAVTHPIVFSPPPGVPVSPFISLLSSPLAFLISLFFG